MRAAASVDGLSGTKASLCGLWFIDQKYFPRNSSDWILQPDCPVFTKLRAWIQGYFAGKKNLPALPLAPHGTAFQEAVWKLLLDIPYGKTAAYGELAKLILKKTRGKPPGLYARAVGSAVGRNPVSLVIPCHRVVGANGRLTGYAGGIERKRALLELEGAYKL
jgi:methylated-DNA-[protein]-cysteine S-methyltransferase